MSVVTRNIIASLVGNGWSAVMSIVFIPLYIRFMGIESYALIGVQITMLSICAVLDMGMSPTINREAARLSALPGRAQELANLTRTMELVTWGIAVSVGAAIVVLAYPISHVWLKPGQLSADAVQRAIYLIAASTALQWPFSFYSGGMTGLQRLVFLNGVTAGMATLRSVGAILVLWLVSPTIEAFLVWQIVANGIQSLVLAVALRAFLPDAPARPRLELETLRNVWRFAAGMGSISVVSMVLSQADKVVLSKLVSLEMFGYYTLASIAGTSFSRLMAPVVAAMFPRFTQLVAAGDREGLDRVFHGGAQVMSVLIMPFAALLVFFPREVILLWTRNPVTAEQTHLAVAFLAMATMLNGLTHLPLSREYAFGRTRVVFGASLGAALAIAPAIVLGTRGFGLAGATAALMLTNLAYAAVLTHLIYRHLSPAEKERWYITDVGVPLAATLAVMAAGRALVTIEMPPLALLAGLGAVIMATVCAAAYSAPAVRSQLLGYTHVAWQWSFRGDR